MRIVFSLLFISFTCAAGAKDGIRLAILPEGDLAVKFADLFTVELSNHKDLSLFERAAIARIIEEGNLSQLIQAGNYQGAGRLLGANALILIAPASLEGKSLLVSRLVTVNQGIVLASFTIAADEKGISDAIPVVIKHFTPFFTKLDVSREKAIPISILNIRSAIPGAKALLLEKDLTALLASRLIHEKEIFVLERENLDELDWEKSLTTNRSEFWRGSYLLEGTINGAAAESEELDVTLRLQSPMDGKNQKIRGAGKRSDLKSLVDTLVTDIRKTLGRAGSTTEWRPEGEGQRYFEEALWAHRYGLHELAYTALTTSKALGYQSPVSTALRIQLDVRKGALSPIPFFGKDIPPVNIPLNEHEQFILHALNINAGYLDSKACVQALAQIRSHEESHGVAYSPELLTSLVLEAGSQLLIQYQKEPGSGNEKIQSLKQLLRKNVEIFLSHENDNKESSYATINGVSPICGVMVNRGSLWFGEPKEVISFYQRLLSWSKRHGELRCFLRQVPAETPPAPFAIDGQKSNRAGTNIKALIRKLRSEPSTQIDALCLEFGTLKDPARRSACRAEIVKTICEQMDSLLQNGTFSAYLALVFNIYDHAPSSEDASKIQILRRYLQKSSSFNDTIFEALWRPEHWSQSEAEGIFPDLVEYKRRVLAASLARDKGRSSEENTRLWLDDNLSRRFISPFLLKFPNLKEEVVQIKTEAPLIITHFWHPEIDDFAYAPWFQDYVCDGKKIWLITNQKKSYSPCLYEVNLETFDTTSSTLPMQGGSYRLQIVSDSIVATDGSPVILTCPRNSQTWSSIALPKPYSAINSQCFLMDGSIYMRGVEDSASSFIRYDLETRRSMLLISSRRKLAQNQFDGRKFFRPFEAAFKGPGTKPSALVRGRPYIIKEEPGNWEEFLTETPKRRFQSRMFENQCLLYSANWHFFAIDQKTGQIEALIIPRGEQLNHGERFAQTRWDPPDNWAQMKSGYSKEHDKGALYTGVAYNGRDLFVLAGRWDDSRPLYTLLWFQKDKNRQPIEIPLQFELNEKDISLFDKQIIDGMRASDILRDPVAKTSTVYNLTISENGLILTSRLDGFWYIPMKELIAAAK